MSVENPTGGGRKITTKGNQTKHSHPRMAIITINVPIPYLESIEKLIIWGITPSRSEWIRTCIKEGLIEDMNFINNVDRLRTSEKKKDFKLKGTYLERNGIKVIREA